MQHEITRLTSENLDLRESIDKQSDQIRKLKKMLKVYAKKLKDGEAAEIAAELEREEGGGGGDSIATVIHRERAYMGMLEYRKEDEAALVKNLILDLKPKAASGLIPGLPAYVLFMCVRHTDYVNDDDKVKSLLTSTINGIKKVVKCVSPPMCVCVPPVPAILEHEAIAGLTASKPSGLRGRASSNAKDLEEGRDSQHALDALMRTLNSYMRILKQHAVDPELVKQIFRQVRTGAYTLMYNLSHLKQWLRDNSLHEFVSYMCHVSCVPRYNLSHLEQWLRDNSLHEYNLSHLEQWLRDNSLHEFGSLAALDPVVQASQLLQARKTDSDVDSVCDMCSRLTTAQDKVWSGV
ncbi:unconventional myosin-Va [Aplysia californica]|uniref:Unconventional myosin-Va n=1 Tax=Aplysia californica TaxID=6500 RepID=A0ABM1W485_APLCA|nr:unconventional myosin-Va [Aplysia californica]